MRSPFVPFALSIARCQYRSPQPSAQRASELDKLSGNAARDKRYAKKTLTHSYLYKRGVELSEEKSQARSKRSSKAVKASRKPVPIEVEIKGDVEDFGKDESEKGGNRMGSGDSALLRGAIAYFFEYMYRAPPESEWHGRNGTLALIMRRVGIPNGSRASVLKVFRDVSEAVVRKQQSGAPTQRSRV